ncbi:MAG: SDR family oxidoreductase, partial [Nanoarchaeota archaeon]|nr:SDR family oxidoreductase [Nanoarchaeota archaeon]
MKNLFDLTGKVAIVTGAARGIGQGIAIELAKHGANVVISDIIPGESTAKKIKELKVKSIYVKTDISDKEQVNELINKTIKEFKRIDILVNNAGIYLPGNVSDMLEETWNKTMNINAKGPFLCSQAALKYMKKGSSIINISSVAGIEGSAGGAAYCA